MSDPSDEQVHEALAACTDEGSILTGWLLVASTLDADGRQRVGIYTMPGQTTITDLGFVKYATLKTDKAITGGYADEPT